MFDFFVETQIWTPRRTSKLILEEFFKGSVNCRVKVLFYIKEIFKDMNTRI